MSRPLVSTDWLSRNLAKPDLKVVDATWYLPDDTRDARQGFRDGHIPGAVFFDIDACATPSEYPHMLPSAEDFSRYAIRLGISESDRIVVYDKLGLFSAARVWWMFRHFGAEKTFLLDGGFPAWVSERREILRGEARPEVGKSFTAKVSPYEVVQREEVWRALEEKTALVLDARPFARYTGEAPEPRTGLARGHMPGAKSLPFSELIERGRLKSNAELKEIFWQRGFELGKPVIATCGSGVSAAVICAALDCLGAEAVSLYDGSWAEWGSRKDLPIATSLVSA